MNSGDNDTDTPDSLATIHRERKATHPSSTNNFAYLTQRNFGLDTAPTSAQYESLTMAITVGPCQTSDGSFRTAPVIKGVHFSVPFRWLGTAAPAPRRFRALIRLTLMSIWTSGGHFR